MGPGLIQAPRGDIFQFFKSKKFSPALPLRLRIAYTFTVRLDNLCKAGENDVRMYIIQRFIQLIPVLIGITFLPFAMMRMAGSDAVTELYGNKEAVAREVI